MMVQYDSEVCKLSKQCVLTHDGDSCSNCSPHQPDESDAGIGFARHRYHVFPEWTLSLRVAETLVVVKSLVVVPQRCLLE